MAGNGQTDKNPGLYPVIPECRPSFTFRWSHKIWSHKICPPGVEHEIELGFLTIDPRADMANCSKSHTHSCVGLGVLRGGSHVHQRQWGTGWGYKPGPSLGPINTRDNTLSIRWGLFSPLVLAFQNGTLWPSTTVSRPEPDLQAERLASLGSGRASTPG